MSYIQKIQYSCGHTIDTPSQEPSEGVKVVGTLCRECRLKAKAEIPTIDSLQKMCPSFTSGSEKQIEFAGKNRDKFIRYWVNRASDTQIATVKEIITKEDSSKWWMDNYTILQTDEFLATYKHAPKKKVTEKTPAPPKPDTMYLKEAIIKPSELGYKTFIKNPIYVQLTDDTVVIVPASDNVNIANILHKYKPRDGAYVRQMNEFTGEGIDRATESALHLLKQGFPIITHNEEVRNRILSRSYKKEKTKWLRRVDDNYAMIKWEDYDKALCTKALTLIPGATWSEKYHIVKVPIRKNESYLLQFAKDNNLAIQGELEEQLKNA